MLKQLISITIILTLLSTLVLAQNALTDQHYTQKNLDIIKEEYNKNIDKVPKFIKTTFGDSRANIHIDSYGQDLIIGAITENAHMTDIVIGAIQDPTVNIYTDLSTVMDMATGKLDILDAFDQNQITYKAVGFTNTIKYGFARVGIKVMNWFR